MFQVASSCLDSSLLKYSAKEYFFRSALCHLSVDLLNAQQAIDRYAQQYPAFQDSREYKLVKVCVYQTFSDEFPELLPFFNRFDIKCDWISFVFLDTL